MEELLLEQGLLLEHQQSQSDELEVVDKKMIILANTRTRIKKWKQLRKEKEALKREREKEIIIQQRKEWEKRCKDGIPEFVDDIYLLFGLQLIDFAITENI